MNLELINSIACGLIALWATWCVLSGRVRDGILGKLIYSAIAISGFVVMTRNQNIFFGPTTAGLTLQLVELLFRLVERDLLNQNRLRQNVQRVWTITDGAPDEFIGIAVNLGWRSLLNAAGEFFEQLTFLVSHGNLSL